MTPPRFGRSLLTTAYFPPVEYFFAIACSGEVLIEQHENYQKQSWRNRCRILSAAGPEDLSIPVVKEERRGRPVRDIRIDYTEPWLQHHIRALAAAYNASAFYEYYAGDLLPVLEKRPAFLFDLNLHLLERLLALLDLSVPVALSERFVPPGSVSEVRPASGGILPLFDGRGRIQPKYKGESLLAEYGFEQAYYQVFVNRDPAIPQAFIPNLSVLDLLSAEGPNAGAFLHVR